MRKALAIACVALVPAASQAQTDPSNTAGLYIASGAGVNFRDKIEFTSLYTDINNVSVAPWSESFDTRAGFAALAAVGWRFGNGIRVEVEGSVRSNAVSGLRARNHSGEAWRRVDAPTGTARSYALMGNILYDFFSVPYVTPYVGVGFGYVWSELENAGTETPGWVLPYRYNDVQGGLGFQAILGVGVPVQAVSGLALTVEYRFFVSEDVKINGTYTDNGARIWQNGQDVNNVNHSIMLGLRYNFN